MEEKRFTTEQWKLMQDEARKILDYPPEQQALVYSLLFHAGMRISTADELVRRQERR